MDKKKRYGCYSAKAVANGCGTFWYKRPDGSEVEVTSVESDPKCAEYKWPGKKLVGEVAGFLRNGRAINTDIYPLRVFD